MDQRGRHGVTRFAQGECLAQTPRDGVGLGSAGGMQAQQGLAALDALAEPGDP